MPEKAQNIAVITARGGSKRVPRKNIRNFHGKPLISWTIANLLDSELFSQVIVSTDSEQIAETSLAAGALVPFLRPNSLADDLTPTAPVADHAIKWLIEKGAPKGANFCVVYPAAVGVTGEELSTGLDLFTSVGFDLVFAGCEFSPNPERAWKSPDGKRVVPANEAKQSSRSQDLDPLYYDAGQFYWSHEKTWEMILKRQKIQVGMVHMPRWKAIDIDTQEDWEIAERLFDPNE